ncbi:hypothetical protein CEXT_543491 [Caerostris extrusa]|uniref:Secreted protein n=1 Tax=Caerostris extrusa TaxID=172846 RepID=A0AAV4VPQ3_CAEEX|nr:hypothetical protein CEXT_543491 [Caerostris extrusa]
MNACLDLFQSAALFIQLLPCGAAAACLESSRPELRNKRILGRTVRRRLLPCSEGLLSILEFVLKKECPMHNYKFLIV